MGTKLPSIGIQLLFGSGRAATWVLIGVAGAPSAVVVGAAGVTVAAGRNRSSTTAGHGLTHVSQVAPADVKGTQLTS